jgi:ubiquinone/menaquinone biosynthesis C-methylase UbiE
MLTRILETEVMNTAAEAHDYDTMDHSHVNRLFVSDLLACGADVTDVLDLGTGTAQIPIELCRQSPIAQIVAVDAASEMLRIADRNLVAAGFTDRIALALVDAKRLPYADGTFSTVISNSIVHHIPEPRTAMSEAVRVCKPAGTIFVRDLLRPTDARSLAQLVELHAADCNEHQRRMFADSLHAALSLDEVRAIVESLGFSANDVEQTSDRHWTWKSVR